MQIPTIIFVGYLSSDGFVRFLGEHRFENDALNAIKQWMQVPLAIRKS